jgi:alkaline phosphatase D
VPEAGLIDSLVHAYGQAAKIQDLATLRATVPHLATWDDHDYGKNDAGADFAGKVQAQQLFLQFWDVPPGDPRAGREGVYHAETFGPEGQRVQVILLDTRYFRSPLKPTDQRDAPGKERYLPDDNPAKTMLGDTQWAWLAERLREPADLRLVVSSIQVLAEGHGWERWGNLPGERARLFDLIGATGANGVVLLSGDRHIGGLYREPAGVPYALTEITSSGINQVFPGNREPGPNRLGAVYGAANFGTIDIDWWERTVTLALRGENGEAVRRTTVPLGELAAGR